MRTKFYLVTIKKTREKILFHTLTDFSWTYPAYKIHNLRYALTRCNRDFEDRAVRIQKIGVAKRKPRAK